MRSFLLVVLGLSLAFLVALTTEASPIRECSAGADPTGMVPATVDGQLIALRPQYGNHRSGNRYTNGRGGQWGNDRTGNKVSGNK
jgi:hypothetical protein